MKSTILFASSALLLFGACSNIQEDDRFLDNPRPKAEKNVLIFEFTGQRCVNCPQGASTVHNIIDAYGDRVTAVNIHPENTQYTIPLGLDLTSPASTFYYESLKPSSFPAVSVDGGEPNYNTANWSGLVRDAVIQSAPADITLDISYDDTSRQVTVDYNLLFSSFTSSPLDLQFMVVENGIVGPQSAIGVGIIMDYVHNHVLRATLYNGWGTEIGSRFEVYENYSGSASIVLDQGWVAENCQIVAYIANSGDHRILQFAEAPIISSGE